MRNHYVQPKDFQISRYILKASPPTYWLIDMIATLKIGGGRASSWVLGLLLSGVSWSFDGGGSSSSKGKVLVFDLQKCRRKMKRNKTKESRLVREMILGNLEQRSNILEQK